MELCQLSDLGFIGYPYTWNNKRPGLANTRQQLDRAVASESWKARFPVNSVTHSFSHASDHLPLILQTGTFKRVAARGTNGFKFEESWLLWEDCEEVVQDAWNRLDGGHTGLTKIKDRIASCGRDLHAWGSIRTHPDKDKIK